MQVQGAVPSSVERNFIIRIFRKNDSKYTKLMFKSCVCGNFNQIYLFSLFSQKKNWNECHLKMSQKIDCRKNNWFFLYIYDYTLWCWNFLLLLDKMFFYYIYIPVKILALQNFWLQATIVWYKRKFCDGPNILV